MSNEKKKIKMLEFIPLFLNQVLEVNENFDCIPAQTQRAPLLWRRQSLFQVLCGWKNLWIEFSLDAIVEFPGCFLWLLYLILDTKQFLVIC